MKNEAKFWESVTSMVSNGWVVGSTDASTYPTPSMLQSHDVRVYVVDVSTGWVAAWATTQSTFSDVQQHAATLLRDTELSDVMSAACLAVNECALRAPDDQVRRNEAISASACSLTLTKTYKLVAQGATAGNWILMIYKGVNGALISRPMYARTMPGQCGFMSPDELMTTVKAVVSTDMSAKGSQVYSVIEKSGGLQICSALKPDPADAAAHELKNLFSRMMKP